MHSLKDITITEELSMQLLNMHNELVFSTILKYYTGKENCSLTLIQICLAGMKTGEKYFCNKMLAASKENKIAATFKELRGEATELDMANAFNKFLIDNETLINKLPVMHKTRKKENLKEFIIKAIYAGIIYKAEELMLISEKENRKSQLHPRSDRRCGAGYDKAGSKY